MSDNSKLRVIFATSEDPDYPASQLNEVSPSTKGWMSTRFCAFPQEIGFQLLDGESKITQIQLLSHQNKISSKVEIFIGKGPNYETATFKRLGYMSLDSNERSNYQARELKTVFIDHIGSFLRLIINENHKNKHNTFNQVGIVAVSLLGVSMNGESKFSGTSPRPAVGSNMKNPYNDLTVDINLDPHTANKLRQLADAKSRAIQNEDYLTAKQIKNVEQELKTLGSRLAQLDMAKAEAVAAEDYDLAKDIKDECDTLRHEIEQKIHAIQIPGVVNPSMVKVSKFAPSKEDDDIRKPRPREVLNVDDQPVGNFSGKKIVKMEPLYNEGNDDMKEISVDDDDVDNHDLHNDRPIRPKANSNYNDRDPFIEAEDVIVQTETFPPGHHPLEGIKDCNDLPSPESLTTLSREYCEQNAITKMIGEYRSRCLYSKTWALREAVILKLQQLLKDEFGSDIGAHLLPICAILKLGVEDKIQQVLFASITLLELVLKYCKAQKVPKSTVGPAFENVLSQLVDKLADGNARLRDGARKGLDLLSSSPSVGPSLVCHHLVKPLPPKHKANWRPIASRLELLSTLVNSFGLGTSSGLTLDTILNFPKATQAYSHSHGEVRDAAKELVVSVQRIVGTPPLEATLSLLRKKQREEYEAAFEGKGGHIRLKEGGDEKISSPPKRTDMSHQHATHNPGGKVPTSSIRVNNQGQGYSASSPSQPQAAAEFTTCMFCGVQNKSWSENDLDLHYWKDCPLLISCPSCAQIVEIAGLPEHLLDECEHKVNYVPCETTGLAIRREDFDSWKSSPQCCAAPENFMYCPLCYAMVEDSDDAWLSHLTKICSKNSRIQN